MDYFQKQDLMIKRLQSKTASGELKWNTDAEDDSFSSALSPNYLARVKWPEETAYLIIETGDGRTLFTFQQEMTETAKGIMSLWQVARQSALGLDKAIDELLEALE
jgi:hypothetical protein